MITYYIYQITQNNINKVGCTCDPETRIKIQQGIKNWEDHILHETTDKLEASHIEAYYKGLNGLDWDDDIYYTPIANKQQTQIDTMTNTLTIVRKEGTKYFSAYKTDLSQLSTFDEVIFVTGGDPVAKFTGSEVEELRSIAQESFKSTGIYFVPDAVQLLKAELSDRMDVIGQNGNDGLHYENETLENGPCTHANTIPEFQQIRDWASDRGIYAKGDPKTQLIKLLEEQGEFAKAILKNDTPEIIDALGDMLVVLINLSELAGYKLEDCLQSAYDVISKRTGKMKNGTFVKDA